MNVLFICSRSQWRSPTAEKVWANCPDVAVRSAGTNAKARRKVSAKDIYWADVIFAMEDTHKRRLREEYRDVLKQKTVHVLDIPDEYQFMDPELVNHLKDSVAQHLGIEDPNP